MANVNKNYPVVEKPDMLERGDSFKNTKGICLSQERKYIPE